MTTSNRGDSRTFAIIGAGMELHRHLGGGFLEGIYQDGLAVEFTLQGIPFMTQVPFPVSYKGHRLTGNYLADFVCYDSIIVEIKATAAKSTPYEQAQMINYLKASNLEHGLLLNFGGSRLEYRRFVLSKRDETGADRTDEAAAPRCDDTQPSSA